MSRLLTRYPIAATVAIAATLAMSACSSSGSPTSSATPDNTNLQAKMTALVDAPLGPPGVLALVKKGDAQPKITSVGTGNTASNEPISPQDVTRIASVSKAFSGAAALVLVRDGKLKTTDTIGTTVKGLPKAWNEVTVAQLLQHTSGLPDYIKSEGFVKKFSKDPGQTWAPTELLSFVASAPLNFAPGTQYGYSDTDNIVVGLIVESVAGEPYETELDKLIYRPLQLSKTSLPNTTAMPEPFVRGYDYTDAGETEDITDLVNPTGAWASGGMLSTVNDLNTFVRSYASGQLVGEAQRNEQFTFIEGESGPPGPGRNSAGLGIFQYTTACGIVYGHTGNYPGYVTFIAATEDGENSAVVITNTQINAASPNGLYPKLQAVFEAAACSALQ
jgi:D-alanyl-D-alanine carboxypeptidase